MVGGGIVEGARDLGVEVGPVVLHGEKVVGVAVEDLLGDLCLAPHGVDGDERAADRQPFEQQRDGGDFVGLGLARLLAEHEALARCPGRDQMERVAVLGAVVGAPRRLAIDGHHLGTRLRAGPRLAEARHPLCETGAEQLGVDRVHDVVQRVVAGDAARERQKAA